MHGTHGAVGANLFLVAYVLAMLNPAARLMARSGPAARILVVAIVLATAVSTVWSIRRSGGGGAGEVLGLMAGALAWVGRTAGPAVASLVAPGAEHADWWRVGGGSIPPILMAVVLWARNRPQKA